MIWWEVPPQNRVARMSRSTGKCTIGFAACCRHARSWSGHCPSHSHGHCALPILPRRAKVPSFGSNRPEPRTPLRGAPLSPESRSPLDQYARPPATDLGEARVLVRAALHRPGALAGQAHIAWPSGTARAHTRQRDAGSCGRGTSPDPFTASRTTSSPGWCACSSSSRSSTSAPRWAACSATCSRGTSAWFRGGASRRTGCGRRPAREGGRCEPVWGPHSTHGNTSRGLHNFDTIDFGFG